MSGNGLGFQNAAYAVGDKSASSAGAGDRADVEYAHDPATSGFFGGSDKKHTDIKAMLDSSDELKKLEAMKRIIGMVAKGRDASELFPAVVKNVASKNIELKKLVYVYLTRYAEEQQDLALLSISTFQRSMKDPNQLIRASALRVLSSVRVPVIVPIMMLAIKDGVSDMSPYVRKAAAHAIPKLYSVDPDQKEELVQLLEKLLGDKTTLVAGSAIQAFEEVCPERIDLIHKNYRKLCNLLVDVEEWGQVVIINMLTRYARSQFVDPNQEGSAGAAGADDEKKEFFSDDEEADSGDDGKAKGEPREAKKVFTMDQDHRLLLRSAKPLLSSRNAAVVLAVAQLYYHCAPRSEVVLVARALTRLLRSHREVQFIVLNCIVTMSLERKGLFEPYIKSFFIRANDPIHIKLLKLEILTNIATETSVSVILREFQTYVMSSDKEFAAATIHSIGRIASSIADITDACLGGLVHLLSNRDETVVGESIVVIKKLLQMRPTAHKEIIIHLAKLAEKVTVPNARASILWLLGEYSDRVPKIAPDVLRKMAKTFVTEDDIVKLQILNLAAKLCLTNAKQTQLLCQYVFALAKYDLSYDIRDRARFLKALILPAAAASDGSAPASVGALAKVAKKIFLAEKPAPVLDSRFQGREPYQLGSLSHVINQQAHGYNALPDWPVVAPDPNVRTVEVPVPFTVAAAAGTEKKKKSKGLGADGKPKAERFYSDSEEDEEEDGSGGDEDEEEEDDGSGSEEDESSDGDDDDEEDDGSGSEGSSGSESNEDQTKKKKKKDARVEDSNEDDDDDDKGGSSADDAKDSDDDDETSSNSEESSNSDSSSDEEKPTVKAKKAKANAKPTSQKAATPAAPQATKKDSDLLLDFLDLGPSSSTAASSGGSTAQPLKGATAAAQADILVPSLSTEFGKLKVDSQQSAGLVPLPVYVPSQSFELLNRMASNGLSASYKFTRSLSSYSPKMVVVELSFQNHADSAISNVRVGQKKLQPGMSMQDFPAIATVPAKGSCTVTASIDFNDTLQPAAFDLLVQDRSHGVSVRAPVGELVQPTTMTESEFKSKQAKLGGMNENAATVQLRFSEEGLAYAVCSRVCKSANVLQVPSSSNGTYLFAGRTASAGVDVLVRVAAGTAESGSCSARVTVNCEKMVIGSMLLKDITQALSGNELK